MGCAFAGRQESGRKSRKSAAALDCSTVRQRRLTSSGQLDSPARKPPTLSCTAALLPKHRLPVASSLAQPQMASWALKSGLYPGRFTNLRFSPGVRSIRALVASPGQRREFDATAAVDWASRRMGVELTAEQRQAVHEAVTQKVFLLTGGPGTGKTTILRAVISVLETLGQRVALAAPTGRATKRLGEAAGRDARTLHRLLEFKPGEGGYGRNGERPLEADAVVVDEISMLDIVLCHHLLQAVPRHASVLFVGDVDQLPSVGPGKFLGDVLGSGVVPFLRLERIFRQGDRSGIVEAAYRVNRGHLPSLGSSDSLRDFYFVEAEEPEAAANAVIRICAERIQARFGLHPVRDVQVLCPMNRGPSASISSTTGSGRHSTRRGSR